LKIVATAEIPRSAIKNAVGLRAAFANKVWWGKRSSKPSPESLQLSAMKMLVKVGEILPGRWRNYRGRMEPSICLPSPGESLPIEKKGGRQGQFRHDPQKRFAERSKVEKTYADSTVSKILSLVEN
jgi:hypothetical protein